MRVLVCGGRNFGILSHEKCFIYDELNRILNPDNEPLLPIKYTIITGGAKGVDTIAHKIAINNWLNTEVYEADWEKYGKAAGYIRNKQMLDEGKPDLVIAFPGGKGTKMMVKLAKEAGVEVINYNK